MSNPTQPQKRSKDIVVVVAVVVAVGLVVVLISKGFSADQDRGKEKAVLGNLRQISAAADQYFLDHPGVTSITTVTIVGTNSTQYIHFFTPVTQETYTPVIVQGRGVTAMGIAGARTITYGP